MKIARLVTPALVLAFLPSAPSRLPTGYAADPPTRVGRVSVVDGAVSFRPAGEDDWADATLNYPFTTGDHLWTDAAARAEITLGSTAVRLGPYSAFGFLALDDNTIQMELSQGSLQVRLRTLEQDENVEIDTPNGAVSLLRTGTYRVDVDSSGDTTTVTVRHGEAEVSAAGSSFAVRDDETGSLGGTDYPTYDVYAAVAPDRWEAWSTSRDRRADVARSARYVSRDLPGYEDLDDYGTWRTTPAYGAVWVPRRVVAGWAPYRYGHWSWVEPWGWTWIDDAAWGFAPFHYGRWVFWNGGWAWVPGRAVAWRPVYAPALVVFIGGGGGDPNTSLYLRVRGGAGAGVAWFPLAPGEVYVPAYPVSDRYVRNVNVTTVNITNINITNIDVTRVRYRNREVAGGVTLVSRETFVGGRPVGRDVVVTRQRWSTAPVVGSAAPVAPTRESVIPRRVVGEGRGGGGGLPRRPREGIERRQVVVRTTPPPAPLPFVVRERALQAHPGRPVDDATLAELRARTPETRAERVRRAVPERSEGAGPPPPSGGDRRLRPVRPGVPEPREAPRAEERQRRPPPTEQPAPIDRSQPDRGLPPGRRERPEDRRAPPTDRAAPPPPVERPAPVQQPPAQVPPPSQVPPPPPPERERPQERRGPPTDRPVPHPPAAQPAPVQPPPPAQPPPPTPPPERERPQERRGPPTERPTPAPPVERPAPVQPPAAQPPAPPERPASPTERPAPPPPPSEKPQPEGRGRRAQPKEKKDSTEKKPDEKEKP